MGSRNLAARAGRWSARHRRPAILGWVGFVLVCVLAGQAAGLVNLKDENRGNGDSRTAAHAIARAGLKNRANEQVLIEGTKSQAKDRVSAVLARVAAAQRAYPQLRIEEVGDASAEKGLSKAYSDDFRKAERLSLPITLVILLLAFGALVAAVVPIVLGLSTWRRSCRSSWACPPCSPRSGSSG